MKTAITCKSFDGRYISERDCIARIEGNDYPCSVLVSDEGDGYVVTLYKGMRTVEAQLMPAQDTDMELALPAMLAGSNYNAALAQLADTLPADPAALNALAAAACQSGGSIVSPAAWIRLSRPACSARTRIS